MHRLFFSCLLFTALSSPALAATPNSAKVWVVQDNGASGYKVYQKAFQQLSLDPKIKSWIVATNQKIDKEHLGKYQLQRLVLKNGEVDKVIFANDYGDLRSFRLWKGKSIGECAIILSANDGLGWCQQ